MNVETIKTINHILKCDDCKKLRQIIRLLKSYQKLFEQISSVRKITEDKIRIYERQYSTHFDKHLEDIKEEEN